MTMVDWEKRRSRLLMEKQTTDRENALVETEWEIEIKKHEWNLRTLRLALFLYRAYRRTGSMCIVLADGRRIEDRPGHGTNSMQSIWNAKSKAMQLAILATGE